MICFFFCMYHSQMKIFVLNHWNLHSNIVHPSALRIVDIFLPFDMKALCSSFYFIIIIIIDIHCAALFGLSAVHALSCVCFAHFCVMKLNSISTFRLFLFVVVEHQREMMRWGMLLNYFRKPQKHFRLKRFHILISIFHHKRQQAAAMIHR